MEQDYPLILPPINRIFGRDIREIPYDAETNTGGVHWWTFLGAYNDLGDCTFAQVVRIRDKKARGKTLEKDEREWYRRNSDLASVLTPKSLGEEIQDTSSLNNGDGISWFENGQYTGVRVNRAENGKIFTAGNKHIPKGTTLHRTYDARWEQMLSRDTAARKIAVSMSLDAKGLTLADERGVSARVCFSPTTDTAQKAQDRRGVFEKTGGTIYQLREFTDSIGETVFIPNSQLADLRRRGLKALDSAAAASYPFQYRSVEDLKFKYPIERLDYRANVANSKAASFYNEHGVTEIEPAAEASRKNLSGCRVMTSRHCILRQTGLCLRENKQARPPYSIDNGNNRFRIETDCSQCEMSLIKL